MDVLEVTFPYFLEKIVFILGSEGIVSLENDEQKHTKTPQISVDGYMISFGHNLRSHISGSSTEGVNSVGRYRLQTEPKINQFKLFISVEQNILGLDVSVNNISFVKVFDSFSNDFKKLFCL